MSTAVPRRRKARSAASHRDGPLRVGPAREPRRLGFYERFVAPELSTDTTIDRAGRGRRHLPARRPRHGGGRVQLGGAGRHVAALLRRQGVRGEPRRRTACPATYFEYLALLRDVFAECKRVLEPGGRIAVNVANLGRRPYRSLAGDVTEILQDLGLLLRGEVVWWKGRAAGGSCAWGTFQRPGNPVLRDVTERIVIASKGRFDRALTPAQRHGCDCRRRPRSRATSSWRPRPTCGRSRPRARPRSGTRRRSRSSCRSG